MTLKPGERALRGSELITKICDVINAGGYSNADAGFACASIAGHAMAVASEDGPEAFAHNVTYGIA